MAGATPDTAMRDAVKRFHDQGVKTVLVSNSWRRHDYDGLGDRFDAVVLSQSLGIRKPDPRIYQEALRRVELPPQHCVFVDDLGGNLKPAKQLGMTTIRHERAEKTIPELERLLLPRAS
jgi:epoxide hydrolase-like predicted phosphatase